MDQQDGIIYITHKRKTSKDETKDIKSIFFSNDLNKWKIEYNSGRTFYYNSENVKIIPNSLSDKKSATVFDYLLQMAQFSEITNQDGENLLVKNLQKTKFISKDSILTQYLNPKIKKPFIPHNSPIIFPFGCNNSQIKAIKTALNNPLSIIQGPPGTGKTQTILNIIANLLITNKSVLIVSNNNTATANVYEKLASDKYGLGFICATLGKQENVDRFLKSQNATYPIYITEWKNLPFADIKDNDINELVKFFDYKERLSQIKSELSAINTEFKYFSQSNTATKYKSKKLKKVSSLTIMKLLQKIQYKLSEKEKFSTIFKLYLLIIYGIGDLAFWKTDIQRSIFTVQEAFYNRKNEELLQEEEEKTKEISSVEPEKIYDAGLIRLKRAIARKYSKLQCRRYFEDGKDLYFNPKDVVKEYPIILSTTFSSRATLGSSPDFLFDYVIMDEASQVDVVTGALALSCAQNAVIVGDEKQLPNVIEEQLKPIVKKIFEATNLPQGYCFLNSFLSSLKQVLPETPQTLLREHYRCHPKIINFCNQQFYDGKLIVMTEDKNEEDVLSVVETVPGKFCTDKYNQRQIDIIKQELLPNYDKELSGIGIIAPYNNQTNEIQRQIDGIEASTVHKFQGREKDYIILSTVDNEITPFTDNSNIINVAITRAKKKLTVIVSGNPQPEKSNIMSLVKYIQYNNFKLIKSNINSIFDFLYRYNTDEKLNYISQKDKISKFDSENAMNILLRTILSEDKYHRFGFVFEMPLKDIFNKDFIHSLPKVLKDYAQCPWTHTDFVIFNKITKQILFGIEVDGYTYHKEGTIQAERDKIKNQIFEKAGIPLIRLSTKGSSEEQIIRETLEYF